MRSFLGMRYKRSREKRIYRFFRFFVIVWMSARCKHWTDVHEDFLMPFNYCT